MWQTSRQKEVPSLGNRHQRAPHEEGAYYLSAWWCHKHKLPQRRAFSHPMKTTPYCWEKRHVISISSLFWYQHWPLKLSLTDSPCNSLSCLIFAFWFPILPLFFHTVRELLLILFVAIGIDFHTDTQVPLTHLLLCPKTPGARVSS